MVKIRESVQESKVIRVKEVDILHLSHCRLLTTIVYILYIVSRIVRHFTIGENKNKGITPDIVQLGTGSFGNPKNNVTLSRTVHYSWYTHD